MTDDELMEQIEACTLPKGEFSHRNHVRLAWLYLERLGRPAAEQRIAETIQRFATSLGLARKYDHQLTMSWMDLVDTARAQTPGSSFEAFIAAHPDLLDPARVAPSPR